MGTWRTGLAVGAALALAPVVAAGPAAASGGGGHSGHDHYIETEDRCDPETFNAAIGEEICDPGYDGGVEFEDLVEELDEKPAAVLRKRNAKGWRFSRDELRMDADETIHVENTGGEAHSFTKLPSYGAGCVPDLNVFFVGLPGFPSADHVPPECEDPAVFATVIGPGQDLTVEGLDPGRHFFECLIHPWMRTTVHVH